MIDALLENNIEWATGKVRADPRYFRTTSEPHAPEVFWIGCSGSRVSANEIVGLNPRELFVHRNFANLAPQRDMSFLADLQYAIEGLKVKYIIVCGHYGCNGVRSIFEKRKRDLIDHWLQPVADLVQRQDTHFRSIDDLDTRVNMACELNVRVQVENLGGNPLVANAWRKSRKLSIHGWVHSHRDGLIRDLDLTVSNPKDLERLKSRAWFPDD